MVRPSPRLPPVASHSPAPYPDLNRPHPITGSVFPFKTSPNSRYPQYVRTVHFPGMGWPSARINLPAGPFPLPPAPPRVATEMIHCHPLPPPNPSTLDMLFVFNETVYFPRYFPLTSLPFSLSTFCFSARGLTHQTPSLLPLNPIHCPSHPLPPNLHPRRLSISGLACSAFRLRSFYPQYIAVKQGQHCRTFRSFLSTPLRALHPLRVGIAKSSTFRSIFVPEWPFKSPGPAP